MKNEVFNAESDESACWNIYRRAIRDSHEAFKSWRKSTYRLRAAIRATNPSRRGRKK